jgi:D-alanyl-D-alanine carboxypeptidase (penicillin-binding protein 5/6)
MNKKKIFSSFVCTLAVAFTIALCGCERIEFEDYINRADGGEGEFIESQTQSPETQAPGLIVDGGESDGSIDPAAELAAADNGDAANTVGVDVVPPPGGGGTPANIGRVFGADPLDNDPGKVTGRHAACYDLTTDIFYYGKNLDDQLSPGGVTKLVTALVAHEILGGESGFVLTVGEEINMIQPNSKKADLSVGQQMDLETALYALLTGSGNDAAYTIAKETAKFSSGLSGASTEDLVGLFADLMNDYILGLGCESTHFVNADGYGDDDQYSTPRDILRIQAAAVENSVIAEICAADSVTVNFLSGESATYSAGLPAIAGQEILGLRAGYTDEDLYAFAAYAQISDHQVITFVSGCQYPYSRDTDTQTMLGMVRSIT